MASVRLAAAAVAPDANMSCIGALITTVGAGGGGDLGSHGGCRGIAGGKGVGGGERHAIATGELIDPEPSRAEPSRAEPSRAEPSLTVKRGLPRKFRPSPSTRIAEGLSAETMSLSPQELSSAGPASEAAPVNRLPYRKRRRDGAAVVAMVLAEVMGAFAWYEESEAESFLSVSEQRAKKRLI